MRKLTVAMLVTVFAAIAFLAGLSFAGGQKQYQFTGLVTEVDSKAKTLSVDKAGEVWEFSTQGMKDVKVNKGDKVTVYYQMVAKKIEK